MKQILVVGLALALGACAQALEPVGVTDLSFSGGWALYPPTDDPVLAMKLAARQAAFSPGCPPAGWDEARLNQLKAAKFEISDDAERQVFAKGIVACVASLRTEVRDDIAYEALAHMLRKRQLSDETKRALLVDLTRRLEGDDPAGVARPFAALTLAEVARADRIEPYLTQQELATLLVDAQAWFINIHDYRGFDEFDGWRHGVAHGADLLMQLALNPRIDKEGLGLIVSAIGMQVAPKGVSYIDGESERLARAILFAASRGVMTEAQWSEWLKQLATPPTDLADRMFTSLNGLAWRHDAKAFLNALYVGATLDADKDNDVLRKGLEAVLKSLS